MAWNWALKQKGSEYAKRHKVIFLHKNALPNVTKSVKDTLEALGWDVLPHPQYSPGITSSDYTSSITFFGQQRMAYLYSTFTLMKKSKNGSKIGFFRKIFNLFTAESICYQKDGKKLDRMNDILIKIKFIFY